MGGFLVRDAGLWARRKRCFEGGRIKTALNHEKSPF
jgi:hypothetical protein